jgi:hypothetical protein
MGKPEGKRALGSSRRRWKYDIKMNRREIGWVSMDWIDLARGQCGACEHGNEFSGSIKWKILE